MSFQLPLRVARLAALCTIAVLIAAFPARADAPPAAPAAPANNFAGQILSNAGTGTAGIGTTSTPTGVTAAVNGVVQVPGTGSAACTNATLGAMRYNAAGGYFEVCTP